MGTGLGKSEDRYLYMNRDSYMYILLPQVSSKNRASFRDKSLRSRPRGSLIFCPPIPLVHAEKGITASSETCCLSIKRG